MSERYYIERQDAEGNWHKIIDADNFVTVEEFKARFSNVHLEIYDKCSPVINRYIAAAPDGDRVRICVDCD